MEVYNEAWEIVCGYCKQKITDVAYNTWISRIKPRSINLETNKAILTVNNDFHRQTIDRCYKNLLQEAFEAIFGHFIEIIIEVEEEEKVVHKVQVDEQGYEYTFSNFIVGNSNKFAHAACLAVAQNPSNAYNPLFLYGESGLGKTHLLFAISNEIKKNDINKKICYVNGEDFTNEMVESLHLNKMDKFRDKYRYVDVLLLDDVQFIGGKEGIQEEFFHTFNALYNNKKQIVLVSDRPPKEIKSLTERLRNRFEMGLIADIQMPDLETRIAIIKRKADLMDINIPNNICEFIATNLKKNIRQLEGTVKKIKAKNMLEGEEPSIKSVQSIIADVINNETPPEVTVEKIIEEVSRTYNISAEELKYSKSRSASISQPRQIAMYIVSKMTNLTQNAIGEEFGGKDHSTVKYAIDTTLKKIKKDPKTREIVDDIIKNCKN